MAVEHPDRIRPVCRAHRAPAALAAVIARETDKLVAAAAAAEKELRRRLAAYRAGLLGLPRYELDRYSLEHGFSAKGQAGPPTPMPEIRPLKSETMAEW